MVTELEAKTNLKEQKSKAKVELEQSDSFILIAVRYRAGDMYLSTSGAAIKQELLESLQFGIANVMAQLAKDYIANDYADKESMR